MRADTLEHKINFSNAKALRRSRELRKMTRQELGDRLGLSPKAVEKFENGRTQMDEGRIANILSALQLTSEDFQKVKRGKGINRRRKGANLKVVTNKDRRSYQRRITKECLVLRSMRVLKKISQDKASSLCGYPRASIGHIENGRIELTIERIQHITSTYGYSFSDFEQNLKKDEQRDNIIKDCMQKIELLDDLKLKVVRNLLNSF